MCWRSATLDAGSEHARGNAQAIDMHAHLFVADVEGEFADHSGMINARDQAAELLGPASAAINRDMFAQLLPRLVDPAARLADMDRFGIDKQLVSPSPTQYHYWADEEIASVIVERQNEAVATHIAAAPDRLFGLGTVALQHPQLAVAQLFRLMASGLKGVQISTRVGERDLGDPLFEPFWAAAERSGALIFIHPYGCTLGARIAPWYLSNILGQPIETSIALASLTLSGVLERHPRLSLLAAHGGGYLAGQSGRIDHGWHARPEARTIPRPPSYYLRRIYYDSLLHAPDELASLAAKVGADRIVLGTDYPFDMGAYGVADLMDATGLPERQIAAIAHGNAERLLGLTEELA